MFTSYLFNGVTPEVALVIAGIHGSELSGIEVANWIRIKLLKSKTLPRFITIIVPEIYPDQARIARMYRSKNKFTKEDNIAGRYVQLGKDQIEPSRQFPKPGTPANSYGNKTDYHGTVPNILTPGGFPVLPETLDLLWLIETWKPVRIASIHALRKPSTVKKTKDAPGVFVDPRYEYDVACAKYFPYPAGKILKGKIDKYNLNDCKFIIDKDPAFPIKQGVIKVMNSARNQDGQKDDLLAFNIAKAIASKKKELVPGNHLQDPPEVVHYSASTPPTFAGYSLGDWGPVKVDKKGDSGDRAGCPIITVEVYQQYESWAFVNSEQFYDEDGNLLKNPPLKPGTSERWPFDKPRCKDLQIYADALLAQFLMQ